MEDFKTLIEVCDKWSRETDALLDDLMYYGAESDKLEDRFEKQLKKYKEQVPKFDQSQWGSFTAQYFIHLILGEKGLINKYAKRAYFRGLPPRDKDYLSFWIDHPWCYSFSKIEERLHPRFFKMKDVFTQQSYLLYSPGMESVLSEHPVNLWLNLVASNGHCYQTFGPICHFASHTPADIHYYTALLCKDVWPLTDAAIDRCVNRYPMPYFLLMQSSLMPKTVFQSHELRHCIAEYDCDDLTIKNLDKDFKIDKSQGILRLQLRGYSEPPHFATAYFDSGNKLLRLSSLTERGYLQLVRAFSKHDVALDSNPDYAVSTPMSMTAESILKQNLTKHPYSDLFYEKPTEAEQRQTDKYNHFLDLLVPNVNGGLPYDLQEMADEAGISLETARNLSAEIISRVKND